jgi:hypothetical protein
MVIGFIMAYCMYLYLFRLVLLNEEKLTGPILKPETFQVVAIAVFLLLIYFSFLGLFVLSTIDNTVKIFSISISSFVLLVTFIGFYQWFQAIAHNPFLFDQSLHLPWYAKEQAKFVIANTPVFIFLIIVFLTRLSMMIKVN